MEDLYPVDLDEQYQAGLISEAEYHVAKVQQAWDALQNTPSYVEGQAQQFAYEQFHAGEQAA